MKPSIVSFGCSLTWGTDLADCIYDDVLRNGIIMRGWSNRTWPALVSNKIDFDYESAARAGIGNLTISDRVCRFGTRYLDNFLIINWTFIDRFDYSNPMGFHFNNGGIDFHTCRPSNDDEISEFYFRHLHSEYRDKFTALMYIKTTLDYLQSKQMRFVMTAVDDLLWCQQWHAPEFIRYLQQEIRPYIHDFEGRNFLDWCRHRGFKISGTGHPLEEAHAAAAELMLPKIKQVLETGVDKK